MLCGLRDAALFFPPALEVLVKPQTRPLDIAVIGSGISGLSAAWLLSRRHRVTLYEANTRPGGHSNTVEADGVPIDMGFVVFNEDTYPNLAALLHHLGVATAPTTMSFAVSLDAGRFEYSGSGIRGLLAQPANLASGRFWSMLGDLRRFYREAPKDAHALGDLSLEEYLAQRQYGAAFRDDHLFPMAAAIWSTPTCDVGAYPARSFIRFFENHGLLDMTGRPIWQTVRGGSRSYVNKLLDEFAGEVALSRPVVKVVRGDNGVELVDRQGRRDRFDHVVIATHADQALALLAHPTRDERLLLGAFSYTENEAVLHSDRRLMPRRRRVWSSWNYMAEEAAGARKLSVTYWMNELHGLETERQLFVTLNPLCTPDPATVVRRETYTHPRFDDRALQSQVRLWDLQGANRTWFCGAYFGAGFHEDGLQAGLAVAEQLGGTRRPWNVADESGRITVGAAPPATRLQPAFAK